MDLAERFLCATVLRFVSHVYLFVRALFCNQKILITNIPLKFQPWLAKYTP